MVLPPLSAATPLSESPAGMAVGIGIVVLFHVSLYAGAQYFFATHLYRDYEVQRPWVRRLFCATFTACVAMLQLLLLELLHVLNPLVRQWVWNLDLVCVLLLLYVVLPVSIIRHLVLPNRDSLRLALCAARLSRSQTQTQTQPLKSKSMPADSPDSLSSAGGVSQALSCGAGEETTFFLQSKVRRLPPALREWMLVAFVSSLLLPPLWFCFCQSGRLLSLDSAALTSLSYTERLLAYVGVCGVTVVSALAGFGSVNYPYRNVAAFLYPTTQSEVACVEQRLLQTLNLISEKKKAHLHLQASLSPARALLWPTPSADVLHSPANREDARGRSLSRKRNVPQQPHQTAAGLLHARSRRPLSGSSEAFSAARNNTEATTNKGVSSTRRAEKEALLKGPLLRGRTKAFSLNPSMKTLLSAPNAAPLAPSDAVAALEVEGGEAVSLFDKIWNLLPARLREVAARAAAFLLGRRLERQCLKLQSEIEALEELSRELFVGLDDLVQSRAQALYGKTLRGRLSNALGWAMSLVCAYRVFMSAANVLLDRVNTTDPATRTLELLLHLLHVPLNVALLTPYLSLLLLGWIIALTIRGFFEKLLTLFRYISTAVSSNVFALVMSEVMGMYFSACLLLTRVYLPQAYRDALAQVLAPSLDFRAFHLYFDRVFVLSSLSCAVSIAFTHRRAAEKLKSL